MPLIKAKTLENSRVFSNIREVDLNYLLATEVVATTTATAVKN